MIASGALLCLSLVGTVLASRKSHSHDSPANWITTNSPTPSRKSRSAPATDPVVVDLPYALHAPQIATSPDARTYYNFSNIRYAAPPLSSLRFQLPADPLQNRSAGVQDGRYGKMCPQAYAPWQSPALVTLPPGEAESEDCLFLDVVVPADVWEQRASNVSRPVIVWIHGGGYQIGAKWGTPMTNPLGLLDRSFDDGGGGVIWVGLQYRVRQFPWPAILPSQASKLTLGLAWCLWILAR